MNNEGKIRTSIVNMLGENAHNNNYSVDTDFGKLCNAVNYLVTQIQITKGWCDDEGKGHVDSVIENTAAILEVNK